MAHQELPEKRNTAKKRYIAGDQFAVFAGEEASDDRILKSTLWVAIGVHAVLLLINFPELAAPEAIEPKVKEVYVVEQVRFKRPEIPPEPIPQRRVKRMPVPDPTPDEPEPFRLDTPETEIDLPEVDTDFLAIPDAPPAPPMPEGPIEMTAEIRKPERLYAPQPRYTELARRARIQGTVIMRAVIDRQGDVTELELLRGLSMGLSEASLETVRQWKFKPATLHGKPISVYFNLTVHFKLQ